MNKTLKTIVIISVSLILVFVVLVSLLCIFINGYKQNRKLFDAIEKDNYLAAEQAIENGAWINMRKHQLYLPELMYTNPTPLISACRKGNEEIVYLLLENGANINKEDNFTHKTPLLAALNVRGSNRFSLAMYLIENGADIYAKQNYTRLVEKTLLVLDEDSEQTIQEGFELFKYLLQHQIPPTISTGNENALTYSAHYNNYNAVKYFIEEDYFNINDCDGEKDTALIVATKHEHVKIVELLLELGANKSIKDANGKTALDYAKENNNSEIIDLLNN